MHIRGKIFLQFLSSWMIMPLALLFAQMTEIAQLPNFISAIVLIASVAPVLIYLNEVFAPIAVRHRRHIRLGHALEVIIGISILAGWVSYRLGAGGWHILYAILFAQCNVWFSYLAARRLLEYQATAVIGGRYSYIIGAVVPTSFFVILLAYWILGRSGFVVEDYFYLLVGLPNAVQYLYTRLGWMAKKHKVRHVERASVPSKEMDQKGMLKYFSIAMLMAVIAQHWKIELVSVATGFAAISVYLISPFSSVWLIISKSNHLTGTLKNSSDVWMFTSLLLSVFSLVVTSTNFPVVLTLAMVTQIITFKFVTDVRAKFMKPLCIKIEE